MGHITLGGDLVRLSPLVSYGAPGGEAELLGLYFADAGQHLEHRVFVVEQLSTGRLRALKLLRSEFSTDERTRERFEQELRSMVRARAVAVCEGSSAQQPTGNVMVCIIDSGYQRLHVDLPDANVTGTMNAGSGCLRPCNHSCKAVLASLARMSAL